MRGEEKPYEMPAPTAESTAAAATGTPPGNKQKQQQLARQHINHLAIQHRLQQLSPVSQQTLKGKIDDEPTNVKGKQT